MNTGIRYNILWNISGYVAPSIAALVSIPLLLSSMNAELFGLLSLIWILFSYLASSDFGINKALCYELSKSGTNGTEYHQYISSALIINLIIAIAISIAFIIIHHYNKNINLLILTLSPLLILTTSLLRSILESHELFLESNIGKTIAGSGLYLFPMITHAIYNNISYSTLSMLLSFLIQILLYLYFIHTKKLIAPNQITLKPNIYFINSLIKFGKWLSLSLILGSIIIYMDRAFIINFLSLEKLGEYSIPFEFTTKIVALSSAVVIAVFPSLVKRRIKNTQIESYKKLRSQTIILILIFNILTSLTLLLLGKQILSYWLNTSYKESYYYIMLILSIGVFFNGMAQFYLSEIYANGETKFPALIHAIELPIYALILTITIYYNPKLEYIALAWSVRALIDFLFLKKYASGLKL
jgi:O-antigen/teichoic acid export membrane protein